MTVKEFVGLEHNEKIDKLAKHNLYVLRSEVLSVKQAILEGRLWEYVGQKARAHPKLMEAFKLFVNYKYLEDGTPMFKKKSENFTSKYPLMRIFAIDEMLKNVAPTLIIMASSST